MKEMWVDGSGNTKPSAICVVSDDGEVTLKITWQKGGADKKQNKCGLINILF